MLVNQLSLAGNFVYPDMAARIAPAEHAMCAWKRAVRVHNEYTQAARLAFKDTLSVFFACVQDKE